MPGTISFSYGVQSILKEQSNCKKLFLTPEVGDETKEIIYTSFLSKVYVCHERFTEKEEHSTAVYATSQAHYVLVSKKCFDLPE